MKMLLKACSKEEEKKNVRENVICQEFLITVVVAVVYVILLMGYVTTWAVFVTLILCTPTKSPPSVIT